MTFYLAMSKATDLSAIAGHAARGERPRHAMGQLAGLLDMEVLHPDPGTGTPLDRLRSRLTSTPEQWALARSLSRRLQPGDVVFCPDEGIGFPVAALCEDRRGPPRILTCVHNIVRPRAKASLRLLVPTRRTQWMAVSRRQTDHLRHAFGVPDEQLLPLSDQTDLRFFTPGPGDPTTRPVLMSVGLEQRDYRTLAEATADMDVDVRISGFSADARAIANAFPETLPANMTRGFYEWPDLLRLYRTASVVVVSLAPNSYAAGIQVLLEAIACRRPVVVTQTEGLAEYLDRPDLVTTVPPRDAPAMRAAIQAKLADPDAAHAQAEAAFAHYGPRIDSDAHVAAIADRLRAMAAARPR